MKSNSHVTAVLLESGLHMCRSTCPIVVEKHSAIGSLGNTSTPGCDVGSERMTTKHQSPVIQVIKILKSLTQYLLTLIISVVDRHVEIAHIMLPRTQTRIRVQSSMDIIFAVRCINGPIRYPRSSQRRPPHGTTSAKVVVPHLSCVLYEYAREACPFVPWNMVFGGCGGSSAPDTTDVCPRRRAPT